MKAEMTARQSAHPYEDLDVIDARAPRFNQAFVGLVCLLAALTGWWPLVALAGLQLIVGLRLGRRYCLPCVFYFEVIQPRIGEGEIEDARAPRFANIVGAVFLSVATLAFVVGLTGIGVALAFVVAFLALFAAITSICVGCEIYRLAARLRGLRPGHIGRVDVGDLGEVISDRTVVQFTHPLCHGCGALERRLTSAGRAPVLIDVSRYPELARKYAVSVVPTAVLIEADGSVLERIA